MLAKHPNVYFSKTQRLTNLERAAYREAGQAVVALVLGIPFGKVTIFRDSSSLGYLLYRNSSTKFREEINSGRFSKRTKKNLEKHIKCSLAGNVAEKKAFGQSNHVDFKSDHQTAIDYTLFIYSDTKDPRFNIHLKLMSMETETILKCFWKEIELLKDALLCRLTLRKKEVVEVVFPYMKGRLNRMNHKTFLVTEIYGLENAIATEMVPIFNTKKQASSHAGNLQNWNSRCVIRICRPSDICWVVGAVVETNPDSVMLATTRNRNLVFPLI
jgi:hypothetical protein